MFGIDVFQSDMTDTSEDSSVKVGLGSLLQFERVSFDSVRGDRGCAGLRTVHNGGSKGGPWANTAVVSEDVFWA